MLHPSVERELFGRRSGLDGRHDDTPSGEKRIHLPLRHVAIALLMMMILGCWGLDLLQIRLVPRGAHESVASFIDSQREGLPTLSWLPDVDAVVGHSPIGDAPITFGSVLLLGALCIAGLAGLGFSTPNNRPK
jgi:hypothetical protein